MKDRITIEGRDGAFGADIARPKPLPAPAVVVLHELFGVNADIRKTCEELADRGFIAVAPDLFWRPKEFAAAFAPNPGARHFGHERGPAPASMPSDHSLPQPRAACTTR